MHLRVYSSETCSSGELVHVNVRIVLGVLRRMDVRFHPVGALRGAVLRVNSACQAKI